MAIALFALSHANSLQGQSFEKHPGNKKNLTSSTPQSQLQQPETGSKAKLDSKLSVQKRGAIVNNQGGSSARNCTPKKRENPYAISRVDFEKLPADRKKFILENASKYSIID